MLWLYFVDFPVFIAAFCLVVVCEKMVVRGCKDGSLLESRHCAAVSPEFRAIAHTARRAALVDLPVPVPAAPWGADRRCLGLHMGFC